MRKSLQKVSPYNYKVFLFWIIMLSITLGFSVYVTVRATKESNKKIDYAGDVTANWILNQTGTLFVYTYSESIFRDDAEAEDRINGLKETIKKYQKFMADYSKNDNAYKLYYLDMDLYKTDEETKATEWETVSDLKINLDDTPMLMEVVDGRVTKTYTVDSEPSIEYRLNEIIRDVEKASKVN